MDLGGFSWEGDPLALEESRLYTDGVSLELILQRPLPEVVFSFFPYHDSLCVLLFGSR